MSRYGVPFVLLFLCVTVFVHAEFIYTPQDVGTLASDRSEARSLNRDGWVVGKYFNGNQSSDFLWNPDSGLQVLTHEADKEIFPKINDRGNVVGFIANPSSWLSARESQLYTFNVDNGFKFYRQEPRGQGASVLLSDTYCIKLNHVDLLQASSSVIVYSDRTAPFSGSNESGSDLPMALNNQGCVLVTRSYPVCCLCPLLEACSFGIYDISTDRYESIDDKRFYYGCGINENNIVIAKNRNGTQGFYGSKKLGMISLGDFIPVALNNQGDIVGKRGNLILLRNAQGTMFDLNKTSDLQALNIEKIVDVLAINDAGQILVTARIFGRSHAVLLEPIASSEYRWSSEYSWSSGY